MWCLANLFTMLPSLPLRQLLSGGSDRAQDLLALCLPDVAPGVGVALGQKADDGIGEFAKRGKTRLGDEVGQIAEEAFDQVEPRRRGRGEMYLEARSAIR